jgi:hypothetical protein
VLGWGFVNLLLIGGDDEVRESFCQKALKLCGLRGRNEIAAKLGLACGHGASKTGSCRPQSEGHALAIRMRRFGESDMPWLLPATDL